MARYRVCGMCDSRIIRSSILVIAIVGDLPSSSFAEEYLEIDNDRENWFNSCAHAVRYDLVHLLAADLLFLLELTAVRVLRSAEMFPEYLRLNV